MSQPKLYKRKEAAIPAISAMKPPRRNSENSQNSCVYSDKDLDSQEGFKQIAGISDDQLKKDGHPGSLTYEKWLNSKQAAAYLNISVGALMNMTSNGHVPYHKLGNRNRYLISELRGLLLSNRRGGFHGNQERS